MQHCGIIQGMNKAIKTLQDLIPLIPLIPGYTGDEGEIVITIGQHKGSARTIDITFSTVEKLTLQGGSLQRISKKKMSIASIANIAT